MKKLLWVLVFFSVAGQAVDILTVGFEPRFKYREYSFSCDFTPFAQIFFLTAEVDGSKILRANIRKNFYSDAANILELTAEEIAGLTFSVGKNDSLWVRNLVASERILRKLFYGGEKSGFGSCYPPSAPGADLTPKQFNFTYALDPANTSFSYSEVNSNVGVFKGTTEAGNAFQISLSLRQSQL